ncbi:MAG: SDR family NAD(P)-dependent oxidoreductase [Leptospirillia bacterium]
MACGRKTSSSGLLSRKGVAISVIVITGASSGVGEALSICLSSPGTTLHLVARRQDRLLALAERISSRGATPRLHGIDVRDRPAMDALAQNLLREGAPPNLIVANAGIRGEEDGNSREAMEEIFRTNVMGVLNTVTPFLPAMRRKGRGQIAIVGSLAGYRGLPDAGAYCASKAALSAWTDSLRLSVCPDGIGVSLVNPGYVATEMTRKNPYPMPFVLSADEAARRILRGLEKKAPRIEFPLPMVLLVRILALLPPRMGDALLRFSENKKHQ